MEKKDVVLIAPAFSPGNKPRYGLPPLGLLSIASVLENNEIYTTVIDSEINGHTVEQSVDAVLKYGPDVVGISVMTPTLMFGLEIAERIKKAHPGIIIGMGGPHVNATKKEVLELCPECDYGMYGESEYTFLELAQSVRKKDFHPERIDGLIYRGQSKEIIVNKQRALIADLDGLPQLDFSLLDQFPVRYAHPFADTELVLSLMTSRGCPYGCLFCDIGKTFGTRVRHRSVAGVVDEMEHCAKEYGVRYFSIKDSTFNLDHAWVRSFCDELISRRCNIHWRCNVRADLVDRELFAHMKKAGLHNVFIGAESGSNEILKVLHKNITTDDIRRATEILAGLKIETCVQFILGSPEETRKTVEETIAFARSLNADYVRFSRATAYPGDGFYEWGVRTGKLKDPFWYRQRAPVGDESFLFDPNTGGGLEFDDFDVNAVVREAHWKVYFRPKFMMRMFFKAMRHPRYFGVIFSVVPRMVRWVWGKKRQSL